MRRLLGRVLRRFFGDLLWGHSQRHLISSSPLFDSEWVGQQVGQRLRRKQAVRIYLERAHEISPHPFFVINGPTDTNPLVWFVLGYEGRPPTHPLVDSDELLDRYPEAEAHPQGIVAGWLAEATDASQVPAASWIPPITLGQARHIALESAQRHLSEVEDAAGRVLEISPKAHGGGVCPARPILISVILLTKDEGGALRRTVDAVLAQQWAALELIIVDLDSSDDTGAVIAGIKAFEDDRRITVLSLGASDEPEMLRLALNACQGRFVAFTHPDGIWPANHLQTLVEPLLNSRGAVAAQRVERRAPFLSPRVVSRTLLAEPARMLPDDLYLDGLLVERESLYAAKATNVAMPSPVSVGIILELLAEHEVVLVPMTADGRAGASRRGNRRRWGSVARAQHLIDWRAEAGTARDPSLVSIIVVVRPWSSASLARWFHDLKIVGAGAGGGAEIELLVVAAGVSPAFRSMLAIFESFSPRVRVVTVARETSHGLAANIGAAAAAGDCLILAHAEVHLDAQGALRLADKVKENGRIVQPLVIDEHGLVVGAGAGFLADGSVVPIFAQHSPDEVMTMTAPPALFGGVIAISAHDFFTARGFDDGLDGPILEIDLSLRAEPALELMHEVWSQRPEGQYVPDEEFAGGWAIVRDDFSDLQPELQRLTRRAWATSGLRLVGLNHGPAEGRRTEHSGNDAAPASSDPVLATVAQFQVEERPPRLRWTIDHAAPSGEVGARWGDAHFARSLAAALRRMNQFVAVDNRDLRQRPTRDLSDVVLVLRGLDRVAPTRGTVAIEWIISHPDLVEAEELTDFDAVFAASRKWARANSGRHPTGIEPLLQCTDPAIFHPDRDPTGDRPEALFVGNSRGVFRTSVRAAVDAGIDLRLYGSGWSDFVPDDMIAGEYVENDRLGDLYASAQVTLNDHWEDMRRNGFLSNRLFDAAACGASILTDEIDDVDQVGAIFGGLVRMFSDPRTLRRVVAEPERIFPGTEDRIAIARSVARQHSFDRRAERLVEVGLNLWRRKVQQ